MPRPTWCDSVVDVRGSFGPPKPLPSVPKRSGRAIVDCNRPKGMDAPVRKLALRRVQRAQQQQQQQQQPQRRPPVDPKPRARAQSAYDALAYRAAPARRSESAAPLNATASRAPRVGGAAMDVLAGARTNACQTWLDSLVRDETPGQNNGGGGGALWSIQRECAALAAPLSNVAPAPAYYEGEVEEDQAFPLPKRAVTWETMQTAYGVQDEEPEPPKKVTIETPARSAVPEQQGSRRQGTPAASRRPRTPSPPPPDEDDTDEEEEVAPKEDDTAPPLTFESNYRSATSSAASSRRSQGQQECTFFTEPVDPSPGPPPSTSSARPSTPAPPPPETYADDDFEEFEDDFEEE